MTFARFAGLSLVMIGSMLATNARAADSILFSDTEIRAIEAASSTQQPATGQAPQSPYASLGDPVPLEQYLSTLPQDNTHAVMTRALYQAGILQIGAILYVDAANWEIMANRQRIRPSQRAMPFRILDIGAAHVTLDVSSIWPARRTPVRIGIDQSYIRADDSVVEGRPALDARDE